MTTHLQEHPSRNRPGKVPDVNFHRLSAKSTSGFVWVGRFRFGFGFVWFLFVSWFGLAWFGSIWFDMVLFDFVLDWFWLWIGLLQST